MASGNLLVMRKRRSSGSASRSAMSVTMLLLLVAAVSAPTYCRAQGISSIITNDRFDRFLSQRMSAPANGFYTYEAFLDAASAFPEFGTQQGSKHELAAFFAQVAHETGYGAHVNEQNRDPNKQYCRYDLAPCPHGVHYYGRGPLQLTWNYNYKAAGHDLGFDGINNPAIVAHDPTISFKTAIWFWMTQPSDGESCHADMVNGKGYGATTRNINGNLECGHDSPNQNERIRLYRDYCTDIGIAPTSAPDSC